MKHTKLERDEKRSAYPASNEVSVAVEQMIGGTIVDAGFDNSMIGSEGGLAFDYEKDGIKKRIIFGYNDLGEWIQFHDKIK